ncbi:transcription elongation factor 1 homolog isoform X1 [Syngnathoides biaculeatus]|uniref:transcription elongation factor 1 homolog isoform X1 n=1 Tax=Syngnathoides biaculeatus TaxID=300417 RepID=UPI002ADE917A|nr:transcription elongation factor 1 homolog isoform X1 [Syngnathoides biaculeatus]
MKGPESTRLSSNHLTANGANAEVGFLWSATCVASKAMGRRKSKRKPPPKKKMTGDLATQFTCPFCNHEKSCDVKMERTRNTGIISCTVCLEEFQTPITYLSEPVDVYSDWIDACESANQ